MNFEKLGNIFPVIRNGANIKQDKVTDGYPITRIETIADGTLDLTRVGYASIHDESFSEYYLQENDILMSHINSVSHLGKVALVNQLNEKVIHGMNLLCLKANVSRINPIYSFYFLKSPIFRSKIKRITKKSVNQASFNISNLKDIEIPVPPLPDQLHIATILSKAENLISQRKESIRLLDEFLKSTFLEMFGDPVRNEKGWEVYPFSELVAYDCPLTYGIVQPGNEFPNGVPVIRPVDLTQTIITRQGLKLIDPKISEQFKRTVLKGGELLMCVRGTTGVVSIASSELAGCNVTRGITPIWFSENYNSLFAYGLFQTQAVKNRIQELTYGATLKQINLGDLRKIKLINPPIKLQTQFAQIVEKTEALKTQYQQSLQELENLYGSLSQKAFKGELSIKQNQSLTA